MVYSHWVTLSTCTGDVIVDRRSFISRRHPSTTQLYTLGWTCMKWTGGRATSGGERWTHTRGKQKHSFSSAYRTLPFQHTHTISVRWGNHLTDQDSPTPTPPHSSPLIGIRSPFSFPLLSISPPLSLPLPLCPFPLTTSPFSLLFSPSHLTSQSSLSSSENSSSFFVRANLNQNQASCRKGRGSEKGGGKRVGFAAIVCSFYHKLESNISIAPYSSLPVTSPF